MMGVRVVCFVVTVVLFVNHAGWLCVIPAAGAIALPYFAVVMANSRQPGSSSGFKAYEPSLPDRGISGPRPSGPAPRPAETSGSLASRPADDGQPRDND